MDKTRVLLIYSSEIQNTIVSGSLRVAPIGLFFINGYLIHKGYETRIINFQVKHFSEPSPDSEQYKESLRKEIAEFDPHYIGYSFRNLFHWGALPRNPRKLINYLSMSLEKSTVEFLREATSATIIGGGSAFMLAPKLYMDYLELDYGIIGEGERAFDELIAKLGKGEDISAMPGLAYRKNGALLINPNNCINDLDSMPMMEIGDMEEYRELYYDNGGYANIQTKRGCAFRCIYCHYPHLEGNKYRLRDVKKVVKEIIGIKKRYDIRHFFIVDSVFSTPSKHSMEFCDELIKQKVDIQWSAHINPRGITRELLEKYKESGCHNVICTPDTLSAKVLQSYRKDFSIDDVKKCIRLLKEVGIPFEVSLILGGPGEDEETVNETIDFCDTYLKDIPVLIFSGVWLHPSTPAMEIARSEGIFSDLESVDLDKIILSNDFETNHKLNYYFPHIKVKRGEFLSRVFNRIRKYKRVIVEKDIATNWNTGTINHPPELNVIENERPWHKGMRGR